LLTPSQSLVSIVLLLTFALFFRVWDLIALGYLAPTFGAQQTQPQPANMSTTTAGSSQNGGAVSSTQTNGGAPHQSPLRAPWPFQVIHGNPEVDQIQVQDWDEEAKEIKAAIKEEELIRV
jgi:hypothetical protein